MIALKPYEVCPFGETCEFTVEHIDGKSGLCHGLRSTRSTTFVCDLCVATKNDICTQDAMELLPDNGH
jgi:hypothetical protein